jgi:hypothetical protein
MPCRRNDRFDKNGASADLGVGVGTFRRRVIIAMSWPVRWDEVQVSAGVDMTTDIPVQDAGRGDKIALAVNMAGAVLPWPTPQ